LAEVARFSRRDAEVYPAYEDLLERISQVVEGLLLPTSPNFPPRTGMDFIVYLKLVGRMRRRCDGRAGFNGAREMLKRA
jgi:hypothetical protein